MVATLGQHPASVRNVYSGFRQLTATNHVQHWILSVVGHAPSGAYSIVVPLVEVLV